MHATFLMPDSFRFIILNSLVFGGAALIVRFGMRLSGWLATTLASALIGWVAIVVGLEILGLFGQIRLIPAIALASCLFAAGLIARACRVRTATDEPNHTTMSIGAGQGGDRGAQDQLVRWSVAAVAVLTAWATSDVLVANLCGPVLPISDAPIYHLYFSVRWWQSGRLELVPTPFGDSAAPYFPANANVWFTWLLLLWPSALVAKVGQWPFLILGMAAVFGLARDLPVQPRWATLSAALWGTGTLPLLNSGFADVDLVLAAWYLVATWFLARYQRGYRRGDLVCCALAMGAVIGTKTIAVLFVPALLLAAAGVIWRGKRRWSDGLILVIGVIIPAAYWYGRNAFLTGNPLYPLHQEVLGFPLLRGWYRHETLLGSDYHIPIGNYGAGLLVLLRGLDPVLLPFWISGVITAATAARRRQLLPLFYIALGMLQLVLFWFINPYQTQDRFLFAAFGLLAVPAALQFERMPLLSVPFAGLLAWHLVAGPTPLVDWLSAQAGFDTKRIWPPLLPPPLNLFAKTWSETLAQRKFIVPARIGSLALLSVAALWGTIALRRPNRRIAWALVSACVAALGIGYRAYCSWIPQNYAPWRFIPIAPQIGYTPGWLALENLSHRPLHVAYAGTNLPFYLFGSRLENEVRYVNINEHADYLMHDYHKLFMSRGDPLANSSTPDWDRRDADESAWLQNLQAQRIDLLFIGFVNRMGGMHNVHDEEGFPIERTWADRHPEIFQPIHTDSRTRLYRVRFQSEPVPRAFPA